MYFHFKGLLVTPPPFDRDNGPVVVVLETVKTHQERVQALVGFRLDLWQGVNLLVELQRANLAASAGKMETPFSGVATNIVGTPTHIKLVWSEGIGLHSVIEITTNGATQTVQSQPIDAVIASVRYHLNILVPNDILQRLEFVADVR